MAPTVELQVVGLGWPRTGTGSLCDALEELGLGPCYHLRTLLRRTDAWQDWELAADEARNRTRRAELVVKALAGHRSAADVPAAAFWRELLQARELGLLPSSVRFVLPRRPAEEWYESAEATVLAGWLHGGERDAGGSRHSGNMARIVWTRLFGVPRLKLPEERAAAIEAYRQHEEAVVSSAPAGSLLRWAPEDGWRGLCAGLGVPEPDPDGAAFPWRNKRGDAVAELLDGGGRPSAGVLLSIRGLTFILNLALPPLMLAMFCRGRRHGGTAEAVAPAEERVGGLHRKRE
mmetsp:Transcript_109240/g.340441  ORF Transcript_109240/g.340441 Transcript_109240/m.340441 type:complete len:290 (+) Transcript_109240:57-926(+)